MNASVPNIPFNRIAQRIAAHSDPWEHNPHQGFLAMSRSGKSFMIRHGILPIAAMSRIVVMDVKPGGAKTWNDYGNTVTELKPGFGIGENGTPFYHMLISSKAQVERFIDIIAIEGSCLVVFDDSRKITANTPDYALASHVDQLLTIGAEIGLTIIICANSTVWATSGLRDQCGINWIGQMANEVERRKFIRQAGLPDTIMPMLGSLPPRHFLYSDRYDGDLRLAITSYEGS
jgi:hypothetical protein